MGLKDLCTRAQCVCGVYLNIVGSTGFLGICVGVKSLLAGVWRTL